MKRDLADAETSAGLRKALKNVAREVHIQNLHRASVQRAAAYSGGALKLNIGCGANLKEGWINIDLSPEADLQLDVREPLPFPDGSATLIYSEHFLEHLEYPDEAINFLRESFRVLSAGGLFSVGVPDTEWPLVCYAKGDRTYFEMARERWHPPWCDTRLHHINYHFRQRDEHKYAYDFETLARVLAGVGFVAVERRAFSPDLDDCKRKEGTLYVDAYKPTDS